VDDHGVARLEIQVLPLERILCYIVFGSNLCQFSKSRHHILADRYVV